MVHILLYNEITKAKERMSDMNDYNYNYSKKDSALRGIVNAVVFAGVVAGVWVMLIGADRLLGLMGGI